jgi:RNA polymerase sigma factor (sigma-70 family)
MKAFVEREMAPASAPESASPVTCPEHSTATDERLASACLKGDEQAWSDLIDRYKNLIYSIPVKYGFASDDAGDIFQSVCVELLAHLSELRDAGALPKWLMQTTAHKCIQWQKRESRYTAEDEAAPEPRDEAHAEQILADAQNEQVLRDILRGLSPRCARMVQMLFFAEPPRSYQEVARELGLATGSIGLTRNRCLEKLRKELIAAGFR